jgi:hypothetical protein
MAPESSKKGKIDQSDKFYDGKRKIYFPADLFIELRLSKRQILKVKGWQKEGHPIIPMWFWTCERVLFFDEYRLDEWIRKKHADQVAISKKNENLLPGIKKGKP